MSHDIKLTDRFEYPQPVMETDVAELVIELFDKQTGTFNIKNIGGGMLNAVIVSNTPCIRFEPSEFSANRQVVRYEAVPYIYKPGEIINTSAVIMSNGGERTIPIRITITPPAIITRDEVTISGLKDFLTYSRRNPDEAAQLLSTPSFMELLKTIGYNKLDFYKHLITDPEPKRKLSNFLIQSGLSEKPLIHIKNPDIRVNVKPGQRDLIYGQIYTERIASDGHYGLGDIKVRVEKTVSWFSVNVSKATGDVVYTIDPLGLTQKLSECVVYVGDDQQNRVTVSVKRMSPVSVYLKREAYLLEDEGVLCVENLTGADIAVYVSAENSAVRFVGKRYFVNGYEEIPFTIKMPALQTAQLLLKKQPVKTTYIEARVNTDTVAFAKRCGLTIGEF